MNTQFQFNGNKYELYTNGKVYANSIQYVEVKQGYQRSNGQWDHESGSWKKQLGNPWFNEAVAKAAGFIKVEPKMALSFGKYAGQTEVPVSYRLWLSQHLAVLTIEHAKEAKKFLEA